ncbi:MAG: hypothetical protein ACRDRL_15275, partial [Sciscionella sp.]
RKEMAEDYGFALAFMNSNKEIKHLFNKAVGQTWTAEKFTAELRGTAWFKHHSASVRNAIVQKTSDPSTWHANLEQKSADVRDEWGKLFGGTPLATKRVRRLANTALMMGWDDSQLLNHMTSGLNWARELSNKSLGGTAAQYKDQIMQLQADYGLNLGNHWINGNVKNILEGNNSVDTLQHQVIEHAKKRYSAFASELNSGHTIREVADPYVQQMATTLEMDPDSINVKDHLIQRALTYKGTDVKPSPMTLTSFNNILRNDHRWQYTANAKQDAANALSTLGKAWGLVQ